MLHRLKVRNLAIVDAVDLELGPGLNVLTGETGAGKSILVTALELLLGGKLIGGKPSGGKLSNSKGRADLVRTGASAAEVEAVFQVGGDARVQKKLEALGVARAAGARGESELVIRRIVSTNGRTRAFVGEQLVTQQVLAEVARGLADISSQHEHHSLTDPGTHLGYLDAFAGAGGLRQRVYRAYHALLEAEASLRDFETRLRDRSAREALLQMQIREIEEVAPQPGEDVELEQACLRLRSMDTLLRLTAEAADLLYEKDDSVVDGLAHAGRRLCHAAELDPLLSALSVQLESLRSQVEDVARDVVRHVAGLRPDPAALQRAEERVHLLDRLKRRHGADLQAVLSLVDRCKAELDELTDHAATSEALGSSRERALAEAEAAARSLSKERRQAASRLSGAISRELESLGMGEARVRVELTTVGGEGNGPVVDGARLSADGLERAELLIAPNRGEEARSLHRIASGGELSRAMLAIKCVLADLGPAGMYVFDEVDAGVGGGMAEIIGRKIRSVAQHRQVLCITHLPQIAVFADHHFKVEKLVRGERTSSNVRRLSEREQREEIARMLGGMKITAKTRAVARELLLQARQTRRSAA
jgi:DNA repair protein RecN (Recombination protein N)